MWCDGVQSWNGVSRPDKYTTKYFRTQLFKKRWSTKKKDHPQPRNTVALKVKGPLKSDKTFHPCFVILLFKQKHKNNMIIVSISGMINCITNLNCCSISYEYLQFIGIHAKFESWIGLFFISRTKRFQHKHKHKLYNLASEYLFFKGIRFQKPFNLFSKQRITKRFVC